MRYAVSTSSRATRRGFGENGILFGEGGLRHGDIGAVAPEIVEGKENAHAQGVAAGCRVYIGVASFHKEVGLRLRPRAVQRGFPAGAELLRRLQIGAVGKGVRLQVSQFVGGGREVQGIGEAEEGCVRHTGQAAQSGEAVGALGFRSGKRLLSLIERDTAARYLRAGHVSCGVLELGGVGELAGVFKRVLGELAVGIGAEGFVIGRLYVENKIIARGLTVRAGGLQGKTGRAQPLPVLVAQFKRLREQVIFVRAACVLAKMSGDAEDRILQCTCPQNKGGGSHNAGIVLLRNKTALLRHGKRARKRNGLQARSNSGNRLARVRRRQILRLRRVCRGRIYRRRGLSPTGQDGKHTQDKHAEQ